MKITTRFGDGGKTKLLGGKTVSKDSLIIELLGEIDELQAFLGLCKAIEKDAVAKEILERVQRDLARIMSFIGFEMKYPDGVKKINESDVEFLEREINKKNLLESSFTLPGGTEKSARLNVARVVCRRAERFLVKAKNHGAPIPDEFLKYLNRLSDFLFKASMTPSDS